MKLLELLVQENVQWPDGALWAVQDEDTQLKFTETANAPNAPVPNTYYSEVWQRNGIRHFDSPYLSELANDWATKAVSKAEYDAAMVANAEWVPVKWGDWEVGDELRFDGYTPQGEAHAHWGWEIGSTYVVSKCGDCAPPGPTIHRGVPSQDWGFKFSKRKSNAPVLTSATVPPAVVTTPVHDCYAELAPIIAAAAEGKVVQYLAADGNWYDGSGAFISPNKYRVKPEEPKTITVNGFDVPEPMREAPAGYMWYFLANPSCEGYCMGLSWGCSGTDHRWLSRGLLHSTKEAAVAHAKAMLGIDPYATEDADYEHA